MEITLTKCDNLSLKIYVQSILSIPLNVISAKYGSGIKNPIIKINLPEEWQNLHKYKFIAGIYLFVNGKNSYLGSSKNLFNRCFVEHKNKAFTNTSKHKKFYSNIVKSTWNAFTLYILEILPNHIELFVKLNPYYVLNSNEYKLLSLLNLYEITIAEQIYMDFIQPTLNNNLFSNWSTYNEGSKGYIRNEIANSKLSFLNRSFNKSTLELHKQNKIGKKLSDITKKKISENCIGKKVILLDLNSNKEILFNSVTSLSRELLISHRTINRWILDNKVHCTKLLKYPLIKIKLG